MGIDRRTFMEYLAGSLFFEKTLWQRQTPESVVADFTLRDLEDKSVTFSTFKGKVILLDFWATWCEPCIAEIPQLNFLYRTHRDRGLEVVGVALESGSVADIRRNVAKHKINYRVLIGDDGVANRYKVFGFPTTYLIDRSWRIHKKYIGLQPNKRTERAASLDADIQALLLTIR